MDENNQNLIPQPPAAASPKNYTVNNIIAVVFLAVFVITILSSSLALSNILFWVMLLTGLFVAVSFYNRMMLLAEGHGPAAKFFAGLVGFIGGLIIVAVSFFNGLIGITRNSPPIEGD